VRKMCLYMGEGTPGGLYLVVSLDFRKKKIVSRLILLSFVKPIF